MCLTSDSIEGRERGSWPTPAGTSTPPACLRSKRHYRRCSSCWRCRSPPAAGPVRFVAARIRTEAASRRSE